MASEKDELKQHIMDRMDEVVSGEISSQEIINVLVSRLHQLECMVMLLTKVCLEPDHPEANQIREDLLHDVEQIEAEHLAIKEVGKAMAEIFKNGIGNIPEEEFHTTG